MQLPSDPAADAAPGAPSFLPPGCAVRRAQAADAGRVLALSAAAFLPVYLPVIGVAPRPATEDYAPHIALGETWLATLDGLDAGALVLHPGVDAWTLYSIAVHPDAQGRGLGRALLAFAQARTRAAGAQTLRLYTNVRMTRNVALYRGAGFVEVGTRPHPRYAGEFLVDMAWRTATAQ